MTAVVLRLLPSVDQVKKNKAAWSGGAWVQGQWVEDTVTTISIPIGPGGSDVEIPRYVIYKLLGLIISPATGTSVRPAGPWSAGSSTRLRS